jgi:hypothetical protein
MKRGWSLVLVLAGFAVVFCVWLAVQYAKSTAGRIATLEASLSTAQLKLDDARRREESLDSELSQVKALILRYQELRKARPISEAPTDTADSRTDGLPDASPSSTPVQATHLAPRSIDIAPSQVESRKHYLFHPNVKLSLLKLQTTATESTLTVAVQSGMPNTESYLFSPAPHRTSGGTQASSPAYLVDSDGHQYALIRDDGTWSERQQPQFSEPPVTVFVHQIGPAVVFKLTLFFEPLPVGAKGLRLFYDQFGLVTVTTSD